jgi:hypothetical protein
MAAFLIPVMEPEVSVYSGSQLREVHQKNLTPNPFPPLPSPLLQGEGKGIMFLAGRGVRVKASLLVGERFGERSECTASNREGLYASFRNFALLVTASPRLARFGFSNLNKYMKAFISYSSVDREFVQRLATDLRVQEGIDASFDQWEINPGDLFPEQIERALAEANVLIFVLSPERVDSRWVSYERQSWLTMQIDEEKLARQESRLPRRRLIPVLYRNCQKPVFLQPVHHLSITDENYHEGLKQLAQAIRGESTKPPLKGQDKTASAATSTTASTSQGMPPRLRAMMLLKRLLPAQFDEVVFTYGVDEAYLPTNVAQAQKAVAVIQYAGQKEGETLSGLLDSIYTVAPHLKA